MLKQILSAAKVLALALILSFGLSYALAWTSPTATPPGGNVDAPINVGGTAQVKTGGLTVGSLTTSGAVTAGTLKVTTGAGAAKVLTSDAAGNATWQAAAGGSDNLGNHTATQALNMGGFNINSAGTVSTGRINASEAAGAYSYISMADDTSTGGAKFIHANSNVIGFLKGGGASWLSYWTDAGDQVLTRNLSAGGSISATGDVCGGGKCVSAIPVKTTTVYRNATVAGGSCLNCNNGCFQEACSSSCNGTITLNATCQAVVSCVGISGCGAATTYSNTNIGSLVQ